MFLLRPKDSQKSMKVAIVRITIDFRIFMSKSNKNFHRVHCKHLPYPDKNSSNHNYFIEFTSIKIKMLII